MARERIFEVSMMTSIPARRAGAQWAIILPTFLTYTNLFAAVVFWGTIIRNRVFAPAWTHRFLTESLLQCFAAHWHHRAPRQHSGAYQVSVLRQVPK